MKLQITSRTNGFWRAGRPWSADTTTVDASEFSAAQLAALRGDPMLIVVETDGDPDDDRERRTDAAIADLDPERHFTKSGKPDLDALRDRAGIADLTAAERDRAWERHSAG